jgi:hypothetical protein
MERLRKEIEALAFNEGRRVGTSGHDRARRYLLEKMPGLGIQPYRGSSIDLPYRRGGREFHNLIGVVAGAGPGAPVLIGAHYDSAIDAPSADDNAAAVAIALEVAATLRPDPPARDLVIALFDAEEPPYFLGPEMGSIRFFEEQMRPDGVHAAIILDLVGHDVPLPLPLPVHARERFAQLLFVTGAESHPSLPGVVERCLRERELPVVATRNRWVGDLSDHHVFRENAVPYLFLTCGRWQHYHQPTDTPARLNYAKIGCIRDFVRELSLTLSVSELSPVRGECDTTLWEISLLREALGISLPLILDAVGLASLESERELECLAMRLQANLGL